jgi:hypothetical protein
VRERFQGAGEKEKGRILGEFTQVSGCHGKAAIRLFGHKRRGRPVERRGPTLLSGEERVQVSLTGAAISHISPPKQVSGCVGQLAQPPSSSPVVQSSKLCCPAP